MFFVFRSVRLFRFSGLLLVGGWGGGGGRGGLVEGVWSRGVEGGLVGV